MRSNAAISRRKCTPKLPLKRSQSSQLLLLLSSDVLQLWAQWWIMPRCMKTTSLIAVNQMSCLVVRRAKKIFPQEWNVFFSLDAPVLCLTRTLILWPLASRQPCLVCPLNLSVCIGIMKWIFYRFFPFFSPPFSSFFSLLFSSFSFSSLLLFFIALRLKHQKNPCFVLHPLLTTSHLLFMKSSVK